MKKKEAQYKILALLSFRGKVNITQEGLGKQRE